MLNIEKKIREVVGVRPDNISEHLLTSKEPLVLKGLVAEWPIVRAGKESVAQANLYIRQFYQGAPVSAFCGKPEIKGRFFYNSDMTGFNYETVRVDLQQVLDKIIQVANEPEPPAYYVGSTMIDSYLPGFRENNDLVLCDRNPLVSIWMGNKSRIAAHFDLPDNIACSVVGRRRFTLFSPDQLQNLYIGPFDLTPAGQSISLVDFHNPDFDRFPKFLDAINNAQVAELEPGDAIFIPSMWWHHVESLEKFNVLVNYWWRQSPDYMPSPVNVLLHALLAIRSLPEAQKKVWQNIFDHYIFNSSDEKVEHIPKNSLGSLGELDELAARKLRAVVLNRLNR